MLKTIQPCLAEAGKIKIGKLGRELESRKGTKFRPPVKLDHFIVTRTSRDGAGDLITDIALMESLRSFADQDGKLRTLPIVLHSDDIDEVFPTFNALYAGKKLACIGDGLEATRYKLVDGKRTGESKQMPCPCSYLGAKTGPVCKPHGTLHCSIVAPGRGVAGAVYKWRTTSQISLNRMVGALQQVRALAGSLVGLPLLLRLEAVVVDTGTVYCCHLELREELIKAQDRMLAIARRRNEVLSALRPDALQLPPAPVTEVEEDEREQADVAQEFYSDNVDAAVDYDADDDGAPEDFSQEEPQPKGGKRRQRRNGAATSSASDMAHAAPTGDTRVGWNGGQTTAEGIRQRAPKRTAEPTPAPVETTAREPGEDEDVGLFDDVEAEGGREVAP